MRVVKFGPSIELCGGCHTSATGNIGLFKIVSESAIAAGIRRIEEVTGEQAEAYVYGFQNIVKTARSFFNNVPDLEGAIKKMIEENATFKKQAEEFARQKAAEFAKLLSSRANEVNGVKLIVIGSKDVSGSDADPAFIRNAAQLLQKELNNTALVAAVAYEGKPNLLLMYSDDLIARGKNAGKDIREAAKFIQGGGGGQPGLAAAGGKNVDGLENALELLKNIATR